HILNLSAQTIIWARDKDSFENQDEDLIAEERFLEEWRKYGPIGVLFDVIASVSTPQAHQLF
ncbi:uncharacterized protein CC84DRAFT_1051193, partial [Paraphaeosphaeria sporulosa]